jgi:hypothetical protein
MYLSPDHMPFIKKISPFLFVFTGRIISEFILPPNQTASKKRAHGGLYLIEIISLSISTG